MSSSLADHSLRRLASSAKESRLLADAQTLAEWVGTGQPLTTRGVLKPAAAVEACGVLGIALKSGKPRSALDIDELMTVWNAAAAAEFIEFDRDRVAAGAALHAWAGDDAEAVVAAWTQAALRCLGLVGDLDEEGTDRLAVLAALRERGGSASLDDLGEAVTQAGDTSGDCSCPDCSSCDPGAGSMYAEDAAEDLAGFAVVSRRGDDVELTLLGRWLADFLFRQSAPDVDVDAGSLVARLAKLPSTIAAMMARPWLTARTPVAAARELLAVAESGLGPVRLTALALARECGPQAMPAWRDWAANKGIGAYARVWLAEHDGARPADADQEWITVDTLAAALDAMAPGALGHPLRDQLGAEVVEILPLLKNSDHPAAPRLLALLPGRPRLTLVPPLARADRTYEIKVQLRDVTEPPVWRRLHVSADVGLDRLHEVIQDAMGWQDGHLHAFSAGSTRYGVPDAEFDVRDERAARLSELLTDVGDKLGYLYDFGDGWDHDITLEKILPVGLPAVDAVCTAGVGACPPEDCGGPWGYQALKATLADPAADGHDAMLEWLDLGSGKEFDPAEFSVEDTNRDLAGDR